MHVNVIEKALNDKVIALFQIKLSIEDFHQWVTFNELELKAIMSRCLLLELKRGDLNEIASAAKSILAACSTCSGLLKEGEFSNRTQHEDAAHTIDHALVSGDLVRTRKPQWFKPSSKQLGADAYFECVHCHSQWSLVEPERQYHGLWERIK